MQNLIEAVKTHARSNYNSDGWDMVVECFEDREIEEVLVKEAISTEEEAIAYFLKYIARPYADRRTDIQAEIF